MGGEYSGWYGVRCAFEHGTTNGQHAYEERVTLWQARTIDEAITSAEAEAARYVGALGEPARYLGLAQAYAMSDWPGQGAEVFSLIRSDPRAADDYLDATFDTGLERQQTEPEADRPGEPGQIGR